MAASIKVEKYEKHLNEVLRRDLKNVLKQREKVSQRLADYLELQIVIEKIQASELTDEPLKSKVDLGCNFYVQAVIPESKYIYVDVGFGLHVQFTLDEAVKFIDKKTAILYKELNRLAEDAAKISAHIKLVLEGLRELQNISPTMEKKHRDVF